MSLFYCFKTPYTPNEIIEKEKFLIEDTIYEIRGIQVMLDSDIAKLYQVDTKRINEAVKNNPDKFPERFSFKLSEEEMKDLWLKISTANINSMSRTTPRVFNEQGLYMIATILKSKVATDVSIAIMDTFVKMRHYINYNKMFLPHKFMLLEEKVDDNTKRINELFDKFDPKDIVKDYIFFEGDFYDSYSLLLDIFNMAKKEIIVVSKNIDDILIKKYHSQYSNVTFINNNSFHDRFIILDKKILYSCGVSLKDLGKKCFAINVFSDKEYLIKLLKIIGM